jgi:RimJ/RimL family protein N-acetyltransferase
MTRQYKCLAKENFASGEYKIVPIRDEDKYLIMQLRNDQVYHLRQNGLLTREAQEMYFATVIAGLFELDNPGQILFSYLHNEVCIGYGGLVHINWQDRNAEISFIIDANAGDADFVFHWNKYLELIEEVAFAELKLHKIFTYAFDLRPLLYQAAEKAGFIREARLKEHTFFNNGYIDVVIHSKFNSHA